MLPLASVRYILFFLSLIFFVEFVVAQDTAAVVAGRDTTISIMDSLKDTVAQAPVLNNVKKKEYGTVRPTQGKAGVFFIGLGAFLIFGLIRYFYYKYIGELFTTISRSSLRRLSNNERLWQSFSIRFLFFTIYISSSGFVASRILNAILHWDKSGLMLWFVGISIILGAFIYKYIVIHSVALVFNFKSIASAYFKHILVVNQIVGLMMLPLSGLILLVPNKLVFPLYVLGGLVFIGSIFMKYLVNLAYIRNISKVNYIHFMVYLCTLEFIPLAIVARYVYNGIGA